MIKTSRYFKLREKKCMKDGHFIEAGQKLLYLCTEDFRLKFKTIDNTSIIRIFWAKEEEVEFLNEKIEDWTEQQIQTHDKEITGNWI